MYCNYLLVLLLSMMLRGTAAEETCVVRVELSDRMINVMNRDELCACLKYVQITTATPKAEAPCSLNILNSGENLVFSADNMCECAGYQTDATRADKLDMLKTDHITRDTTLTESTVTDVMTTNAIFFLNTSTVTENDIAKSEYLSEHSSLSIIDMTEKTDDLIKDVKATNDSNSTVFISTTDNSSSALMLFELMSIEPKIYEDSYNNYAEYDDYNTAEYTIPGHINSFTVTIPTGEVVKNITNTLNVTEKWDNYIVNNFTSATDDISYYEDNYTMRSISDEYRFHIKPVMSINFTNIVYFSEITKSLANVSEATTEMSSHVFEDTKHSDLYNYSKFPYPEIIVKPISYLPESEDNTTTEDFKPNETNHYIIDGHGNRSTTEANDEARIIEYEKVANTKELESTEFIASAVTTHATFSVLDTTQTSDSQYGRHQNQSIEKDVSITNMVLIIILSLICIALIVLFIVKMIYGCLRAGSYALPHTPSKNIEMVIRQ